MIPTPTDESAPPSPAEHLHAECSWLCQELARRYEAGESLAKLGMLGLSMTTVAKFLRWHGVQIRPRGRVLGTIRTDWHEEACRRFAAGETATEIGLALGLSRERVRQVLHLEGFPQTRQPRRPHQCTPACEVVRQAPEPVVINPLARASGIIPEELRRACRIHGLTTSVKRGGHRCDARCAALREGLDSGLSATRAAIQAGFSVGHVQINIKVYHPDWPWPTLKTLQRHRCTERCELARLALLDGGSYRAASHASGINLYNPGWRRAHPEWPWK